MPPLKAARLPLRFDPAGLQADLGVLGSGEWTAHFNTEFYSGDWSGAALRSPGGAARQIEADTTHGEFADTALLQQCTHLRAVVEAFQCPLRSVRLLMLTAGSVIREHRDYDLGYDVGEVRVHVPVITNPAVEFYLDNSRITMAEGECWYLDLNLPHRVQNLGQTDRIHLVIDCQLNDWLRELIARGEPGSGTESGYAPFHRHVLGDQSLQEELAAITDRTDFIARTVALGRAHGFSFLAEDVEAALQAARRHLVEGQMI